MSKLRTDSWAANLTEEQSWALYYKARGLRWNEATDWAVKEFGVDAPSRTAFYAWLGRMRKEESAHRLEQAATAAAEAAALAKKQAKDDALVGAFKAMAAELALRTGSAGEAGKFMRMALDLTDRQMKRRDLGQKDEQLKLAREKFEAAEKRLNAVQEAVKSAKASGGGLSEETLRKIEEAAGLL